MKPRSLLLLLFLPLLLLLAWVGTTLLLHAMALHRVLRSLSFRSVPAPGTTPLQAEREREVYLDGASDALLHGVEIRDPAGSARWVVVFKGNSSLWETDMPFLRWLAARLRANLLCFNYRATGNSSGRLTCPSELCADGAAVASHALKDLCDGDPARLLLYGFSLGGAVAANAARHLPPGVPVCIDRSFTRLSDALRASPSLERYPLLGAALAWLLPAFLPRSFDISTSCETRRRRAFLYAAGRDRAIGARAMIPGRDLELRTGARDPHTCRLSECENAEEAGALLESLFLDDPIPPHEQEPAAATPDPIDINASENAM